VAVTVPVAVIISMAVSIAMTIPTVVAMRITVLFVLAVMVPVIVAIFSAVVAAVEVPFPAGMPAPIGALVVTREPSVIAVARIKPAIVMSTEAYRPSEPRPSSNKDAGLEPLRPVVAEWSASIR